MHTNVNDVLQMLWVKKNSFDYKKIFLFHGGQSKSSFSDKLSLAATMQTHPGEKPYFDTCKSTFTKLMFTAPCADTH